MGDPPGFRRQLGRLLDGQTVGMTAVMVDIVHEGNGKPRAGRQQIAHAVALVIIFQRQPGSDGFGKIGENLIESFQRQLFVAIDASGMDIDDIRAHCLGQGGLVLQFAD